MNRKTVLKFGAGASALALVAALGLANVVPTLAQSLSQAATPPTTQSGQTAPKGLRGGRGAAHMDVIAKALNMTEADLQTELQAGKSVADVASAKGVSLDTIVSAVVAAETDELKQKVTAGTLTQAQADTLLANLKATLSGRLQTKMVAGLNDHGKGGPHGQGGPGGFGIRGGSAAVIAKALNITEADLKTELQAGKSVADVASAKSVSLDTIVSAIVADETTELKQAVTDGKLTQAQADDKLAKLKTNLPTQLAQKGIQGGPGRGHGTGTGSNPTNSPLATPAPGA